ncbi:outer membrane protein assembly factor BamA [Cognatishimia sp.]|uniref:outer membrane protein assembly factor BamA n=1 Tax=Cognatishimia sp. TaxID=2211648 RepID=UPI003BACEE85
MSSKFGGSAGHRNMRKATLRQTAIAFSVLVSMGFLATPNMAEAQNYRFSTLLIEGNNRIEDAAIASYTGIARGQVVSAGDLNDAYQRILATGLFETVELVPSGNRLVIRVTEFPTINVVKFEGNRRLKDDVLEAVIESQSRRVLNPATAERDADAIAEAYAQSGRIAARVTPRVIRRSENRADLVFEIFEGSLAEIERLSFVGNRIYSDRRLRRELSTKQAGLLRAVVKRDTLVEDRIEFDKQLLRDFYQARGYVDFRVTGVNAELARERDAYFLTFNVEEGQQFSFGEITVVSDLPEVDVETFEKTLRIKPGKTYSPLLVENAIARMESKATQEALDFIRVEPRVSRNDRDLTLDVEFALVRGPRVFVERIDIEGNTTTLDRVVRRQFNTAEGDPFNPREIREAAERIRALGFFTTSEVNARQGSSPDQVIVDVDVEEQPTGSLTFGGTYSTDSGFGLVAGFTERNFLGRGQSLSVNVSTSPDVNDYQLRFVEPAFLGRDVSLGFDLSYQDSNLSAVRFENTIGQIQPFIGFSLGEQSAMQLRYTYESVDMVVPTSIDPNAIVEVEADRGRETINSIGYTYTFDSRIGGLNPDAGVLLEFGQDFAGPGSDVEYIKTSARAVAQRKVFNGDVTLRATLEGGAIHAPDNNTRVHNRFALSSRQFRGFEPFGMGPREISTADDGATLNDGLGGKYYAVARFEAEFPLGLPEEYGISGGLFYDVGSLWGVDGAAAAGNTLLYDDFTLRQTVGLSIFWTTPIGPLRFNWSKAVDKQAFDQDQTFNLTIRTEF